MNAQLLRAAIPITASGAEKANGFSSDGDLLEVPLGLFLNGPGHGLPIRFRHACFHAAGGESLGQLIVAVPFEIGDAGTAAGSWWAQRDLNARPSDYELAARISRLS